MTASYDRIGELRRLFDEAFARRSARPSDAWSIYSIARSEHAWWKAVRRACEDYLNEQLSTDVVGYFSAVENELELAKNVDPLHVNLLREMEERLSKP